MRGKDVSIYLRSYIRTFFGGSHGNMLLEMHDLVFYKRWNSTLMIDTN